MAAIAALNPLVPLPDAMRSLPTPKSRPTGVRWLRSHPGLGLTIGHRHYLARAAVEAIGRGVSLSEAERIGAAAVKAMAGERAAA